MKNQKNEAVFLITCNDRKGLLAAISGFFYTHSFNIVKCQQYSDTLEQKYFMRVRIDLSDMKVTRRKLEDDFSALAVELKFNYTIFYTKDKQNIAIMVSKTSHCLYDLLMNQSEGTLPCEIPLIIGNHPDLELVANRFEVPYYCLPMTSDKTKQEAAVLELLSKHHVDLVVMARYMQILSENFIACYPNKIINIHHAFLPAFQGGNPYQRAWERGVKMIGATAHYATGDLDEGPIIEQDVERIGHESTPDDLKEIGKDIERRVLTRAVNAHLDHRIIPSGCRTIVFTP